MKKREDTYESCYECAIALGAKVPPGDLRGITVHGGECPYCKKPKTLIPHCDFDWPKEGKKAWFD